MRTVLATLTLLWLAAADAAAQAQQVPSRPQAPRLIANLTRNWRLMATYANNEVVNTGRVPLLKAFRDQAKAQNKPVLLYWGATWCPPCQQETPILRAFDRAYRERGLQIIGISVQELQGSVAAYAERYGLEYPIVMDVDGALFRAASAGGLPTKILLNPSGRVLAVLPRPFTAADGATLIEPLLTP